MNSLNKLRNTLALATLVLALAPATAQAGRVYFTVAGAGVYPQSITDGTDEIRGKFGYGGGALLGVKLGNVVGLEAGGFYLIRKFGSFTNGVEDTSSNPQRKSVYIPAGLRFHIGRVFTLQGGAYYDTPAESGLDPLYGAYFGLGFNIPMGSAVSLFIDARYNLGLKDIDGAKPGDLVLGLVGLRFGGQTK
jgi:hypothetical protein